MRRSANPRKGFVRRSVTAVTARADGFVQGARRVFESSNSVGGFSFLSVPVEIRVPLCCGAQVPETAVNKST